MARRYTISRTGFTPTQNQDVMTIIAPANKMMVVKRVIIDGEATASTVHRLVVQRSTGGVTGGGALTPEKTNSSDPAASTTVNTTWATQPTLSGAAHYARSFNTFGGSIDLIKDGREIYLVNSEQLSIRFTQPTSPSVMSMTVEIEEL